MAKVNFDKHIWEGWTVRHFIEEFEPIVATIMSNNAIVKPFSNSKELAKWCVDNQPYYKKVIPDIVDYFSDKYNIY